MSHEARATSDMESETAPLIVPLRRKQGIRAYALLVLGMAVVTLIVTSLCVLIIRYRWRTQVTEACHKISNIQFRPSRIFRQNDWEL